MHVSVKEQEEEYLFYVVANVGWAKFIYVKYIYAKVIVTHNNADKPCAYQRQHAHMVW